MRITLIPALLLALSNQAQWVLTTPIKTRSEFEAIRMVNATVGYAVDKPMGAILRTRDGGAHWERMANNLGNAPVALFMWDELRGIVVGESGHVYRTTDGFETITGAQNPTFGELSCVHFVNDTLGWAGSVTGKIFRSTNGGTSWTQMNSGQPTTNYMTAIRFVDTQVGYASCYAGEMLKSTDGGLSWQEVGPFDQLVLMRDLHFFNAEVGVAVGSAGEVIRTTDGGLTWDSIPSNTTYTMRDLDAVGDTLVACGDFGRLIRSTDGGLSWTEIQAGNTDHQSLSLTPDGMALLGTNGRIQRSNDFGSTWSVLVEGTWHTRLNKVSFANGDTGVAVGWQTTGGFESGTLRTWDGGRHWEKAGPGGLGVHLNAQGFGCRGGSGGGFARTSDFFANSTTATGPNVAIRCTWSFDANTHIVAGGAVLGGIYRTTNAGQNWTHVLNVGNITISDLWFANDTLGFAVGEYGDNYRTTDGGLTWEPNDSGGDHSIFFLNAQLGWTRLRRTTDGGVTWTPMSGTPQQTMSIFFTDPDTGYAVSYTGQTVRSVDGGITWSNFLPEILNASVGDAAWADGAIVITCNNGDIFRAQVSCPVMADVPVITEGGASLCVNTAGSAQWYLDGDVLPGDTTTCITPDATGAYTVVVTDPLGCVSAASMPYTTINTGSVPHEPDAIQLFPVPAVDMLTIDRNTPSTAVLIIMDAQGRVLRTERVSGARVSVDVRGLSPGIHVVRLMADDRIGSARFVKE